MNRTLPGLQALTLASAFLGASACAYFTQEEPAADPSGKPKGDTAQDAPAPPPAAAAESGAIVRLRGSSTIGATLAPQLALAFLTQAGSRDAKIDDSERPHNRATVKGHAGGQLVTFVIDYPGSKAAFECLGTKSCEIGMASRPVTAEEAQSLSAIGDVTSPAAEHVVAMDGIAVVVNRANRIEKLSVEQIGDIFGGGITDWSQIGGSAGPIHRYIRDKRSGTYETFVQLAMHGKDIPTTNAKVLDDNGDLSDAVAADEGGIGFAGLPYVRGSKAIAVQDGDAVALSPTSFTVSTEDYAFSRRLFFYTPEHPSQGLTSKFVDYALSDEGQKVVARAGFVSLAIDMASPPQPANAPDAYTSVVSGAHRLSFNFRFRAGTSAVDGKATQDLARLARYLRATSSHGEVSLFGFADNQGAEARNIEISQQRAKSVADVLKQGGIESKNVIGFGSALAIAPNTTAEGRNKNRRVEIWLK
jgi:phosphate transport system substrate-binding protein